MRGRTLTDLVINMFERGDVDIGRSFRVSHSKAFSFLWFLWTRLQKCKTRGAEVSVKGCFHPVKSDDCLDREVQVGMSRTRRN